MDVTTYMQVWVPSSLLKVFHENINTNASTYAKVGYIKGDF